MGLLRTGSGRGQSEVLGIVLLFALVLGVSMTVVVIGGQALNDAKADTSSESAAITMEELQSKAAQSGSSAGSIGRISFAQSGGGSEEASGRDVRAADGSVQIDESDSVRVDENAGHITVEVTNSSTGNSESFDHDLGSIEYEEGGETLVFQGGGVFRQTTRSDESVIVSPPEFSYQYQSGSPTLSMGITRLRVPSDGVTGDSFSLQQGGSTRHFPNSNSGIANQLGEYDSVTITIESKYCQAWQTLFQERTDGSVTPCGNDGEVTLVLNGLTPPPEPVDSALATGSNTQISNVGEIDSYRSSDGPYPGWRHREEARVGIRGDFESSNNPEISGDLHVTGRMHVSNKPVVYGNTILGGTPGSGDADFIDGGGQPEFHGLFSTQDDFKVISPTTFGDDLIVGGDVQTFKAREVQGSLYVGQDVDLAQYSGPSVDIHGNIVANGDVYVRDRVDFIGTDNKIIAGGDVIIYGSSHDVDIISDGNVRVGDAAHQSPTVSGNVSAGDSVTVHGRVEKVSGNGGDVVAANGISGSGTIEGDENQYGSPISTTSPMLPSVQSPKTPQVSLPDPATDEINQHRSDLSSSNDNGEGPISDIENAGDCDPCTLESGEYYLDEIQITDSGGGGGNAESLTLDTSEGDIVMYVENDIEIKETIEVIGENNVLVYTDGSLLLESSTAEVLTPDDDASQFRLFMKPDSGESVTVQSGNPVFTGVIYGLGPTAGSGVEMSLSNNPTINGAIIGNIVHFSNSVSIHYDETLANEPTFGDSPSDSDGESVGYLQISTTDVEIED